MDSTFMDITEDTLLSRSGKQRSYGALPVSEWREITAAKTKQYIYMKHIAFN